MINRVKNFNICFSSWLCISNRINFEPHINEPDDLEERISRRCCEATDGTDYPVRRWLTRENAADAKPTRDGQIGPDPVSWPLPFLSDVFMSRSAGHSSFLLCVCPSARSLGSGPRDVTQPPTPRRRPLLAVKTARHLRRWLVKKRAPRVATGRRWRWYREPCEERATRMESSESEAEATMPVVATLKGITIESDYVFIILVSKLKPELNTD